jgi:hypothetical protein
MIQPADVTRVTDSLQFAERQGLSHATIGCPPDISSRGSPEKCMSKIEFKTVLLPYKTGIFQSDSIEVAEMLNKEGVEGWHLSQIVLPSTVWGRANTMVAILERSAKG